MRKKRKNNSNLLEELLDFRSRTQDAALLFDEEIAAYINEIYARGVKLMSTGEALKGTAVSIGEERDEITVENARHTIWLADQIAMVDRTFGRYPGLRKRSTRPLSCCRPISAFPYPHPP